jgi:hypothetical protein
VVGSGGMSGTAGGGAGNSDDASVFTDATGAGGQSAVADAQGAGGQADADGEAGDLVTKVVKTTGCGKDPGQAIGTTVMATIPTMGTKATSCADAQCGAWSYPRDYYVTLPVGYEKTRAYPLVLEGPGCGGTGIDVYPLSNGINGFSSNNVDNTVIRVGLTPPPNTIGHATNPNQGCFDDKEGDDSVDFVFYETLYDRLAGQLCFDKNRVFASGNSSGSWLGNELVCKYAGDAARPVRGVLVNAGGFSNDPKYTPTCTTKPMAGMWVYNLGEPTTQTSGDKLAIARAMKVNGCTIGTTVETTQLDNFPIGGGMPETTCKKIQGCPDLYPLVVCERPGSPQTGNDDVVNPGFSTFIKLFENPPLLTP